MFWTQIHQLDQELTLWINSIHNPAIDPVMQFFSSIPAWIPMYAAVLGCLFWRLTWKKALVVTISLILTVLLCDQLSNLIKDIVQRLRPCHDNFMVSSGMWMLEGKGGLYGFFSGHSANSFGFAVCSSMGFSNDTRLRYRGYKAWIFFWAAMVSISRIFVGKHYLGDVIVGICVGIMVGYLMGKIAKYAITKLK